MICIGLVYVLVECKCYCELGDSFLFTRVDLSIVTSEMSSFLVLRVSSE